MLGGSWCNSRGSSGLMLSESTGCTRTVTGGENFIEVLVCSSVLLFSVAISRSVAIQLFCAEICSTSVSTPAGQV